MIWPVDLERAVVAGALERVGRAVVGHEAAGVRTGGRQALGRFLALACAANTRRRSARASRSRRRRARRSPETAAERRRRARRRAGHANELASRRALRRSGSRKHGQPAGHRHQRRDRRRSAIAPARVRKPRRSAVAGEPVRAAAGLDEGLAICRDSGRGVRSVCVRAACVGLAGSVAGGQSAGGNRRRFHGEVVSVRGKSLALAIIAWPCARRQAPWFAPRARAVDRTRRPPPCVRRRRTVWPARCNRRSACGCES